MTVTVPTVIKLFFCVGIAYGRRVVNFTALPASDTSHSVHPGVDTVPFLSANFIGNRSWIVDATDEDNIVWRRATQDPVEAATASAIDYVSANIEKRTDLYANVASTSTCPTGNQASSDPGECVSTWSALGSPSNGPYSAPFFSMQDYVNASNPVQTNFYYDDGCQYYWQSAYWTQDVCFDLPEYMGSLLDFPNSAYGW